MAREPKRISYAQSLALQKAQQARAANVRRTRAARAAQEAAAQERASRPTPLVLEEHVNVLCPGGLLHDGTCGSCGRRVREPFFTGTLANPNYLA